MLAALRRCTGSATSAVGESSILGDCATLASRPGWPVISCFEASLGSRSLGTGRLLRAPSVRGRRRDGCGVVERLAFGDEDCTDALVIKRGILVGVPWVSRDLADASADAAVGPEGEPRIEGKPEAEGRMFSAPRTPSLSRLGRLRRLFPRPTADATLSA